MSTNLLSRVADRIYWAARYLERAEDTARIVRANGEMLADLPKYSAAMWRPLISIVGSGTEYDARLDGDGQASPLRSQSQSQSSDGSSQAQSQAQARADAAVETAVVGFLLSDTEHGASIVSCVAQARENLRTTRETVPRDGWQALNDLYLYVVGEVDRGVDRRARERYLGRVIADSRRIDGILATTMNHDEAYAMWRLGRALERADMTTRVLGVRAAAVLMEAGHDEGERRYDELQWMGVLKSLSGLQMYQRAVRGPIDGAEVVRFLLEHDRFPRAVRALLRELRRALAELPDPGPVIDQVDAVDAALRQSTADGVDGAELDDAMDASQVALAQLDRRIHDRYLRLA